MTGGEGPVLDLVGVRIGDAPRVGPKVARLAELAAAAGEKAGTAAGWKVPDGYAVTVDALDGWLPARARADLTRVFAGAGDLGRQSRQARAIISSEPLPAWLTDAVAAGHERLRARTGLGDGLRVAVRSSAIGEDSAQASFAGQFSTYLGVTAIPDVCEAIRACWASGFTEWALEYRRRLGQDPVREHRLAVGVLQLVDVRSAGVIFTIDPVSGDRGRMVVEANWGFGESVVSGAVTPDHWEADAATHLITARSVGAKQHYSRLDPDANRVVLTESPAAMAAGPCLSEEEVRLLCRLAAGIAEAEGVPQDVEWAIARDGTVFLLQHRPETTWRGAPEREPEPPAFNPVQYALRNVFKVPGS
jgi:phosphoenolpyruvate synthase/pyruvate phosphate dikinase